MKVHGATRLTKLAPILAIALLNGCAFRPYAGIGVVGPGWGYGPVRIGTGANIGIALPPIR